VQTDEQIEEDIVLFDDDSEELVSFMRRIGPAVLQELEKNNRSHAFDGKTMTASLWATRTCTSAGMILDVPKYHETNIFPYH